MIKIDGNKEFYKQSDRCCPINQFERPEVVLLAFDKESMSILPCVIDNKGIQ